MICEECGEECDENVCHNCGLEITSRPIAFNKYGYIQKRDDITTLYSAYTRGWDHPLSPKIRKRSKSFVPKYQKKYEDYVYVKAFERIKSYCASLDLPENIFLESMNLFKRIQLKDESFFKRYHFEPSYLACIKIACKIHDFPILNYDLASVSNYLDDDQNLTYMTRKFNNAYKNILRLFNLKINKPEHPNFIGYICSKLNLPISFLVEIHTKYNDIKKCILNHFKIEGYILALVYIYGNKRYNITLEQLSNIFHISPPTIRNRKNEILNMCKVIVIFKDESRDKKIYSGAIMIDLIGKIRIIGTISKDVIEYDLDEIKEVKICP